jgi:hypothetical protein
MPISRSERASGVAAGEDAVKLSNQANPLIRHLAICLDAGAKRLAHWQQIGQVFVLHNETSGLTWTRTGRPGSPNFRSTRPGRYTFRNR